MSSCCGQPVVGTLVTPAKPVSGPAVIRVTVKNDTELAKRIAEYPGYAVSRRFLGNSILLTFTHV